MTDRVRPFWLLFLARLREFIREPEVVFWVFGFPVLLAVGLGIAFRERPPDRLPVDVVAGPEAARIVAALAADPGLVPHEVPESVAADDLRLGRTALVVVPGADCVYRLDPARADCVLARRVADDAIQRAAGRADPVPVREETTSAPGSRYIDFLIPGLLGMNVMSGGMWGVGYALTEMRSRRLMKRLVATPMRRSDFLAAVIASRMFMVFLELAVMLPLGALMFGMPVRGSVAAILLVTLLGAFCFSGIGLLVASRSAKIETVSGLVNLVMLPMFVFSGVFFSSDRFPDVLQPFIQALPLTVLNNTLRAVILEGAGLWSQAGGLLALAAWGGVCFAAALRWFRWI